MGSRGEGSGALQDTALGLSLGPPAHLPASRPEGLEGLEGPEGPGEKAETRPPPPPPTPRSLPRGPLGAERRRSCSPQGLALMAVRLPHPCYTTSGSGAFRSSLCSSFLSKDPLPFLWGTFTLAHPLPQSPGWPCRMPARSGPTPFLEAEGNTAEWGVRQGAGAVTASARTCQSFRTLGGAVGLLLLARAGLTV